MSDEVFEMLKAMDRRNVELQLLLQCGPTIAGLKTSNLLIVPREDEQLVRTLLSQSGLLNYRMAYNRQKVVFLVFDRALLSQYLEGEEVRAFLKSQGYSSDEFGYVLKTFQKRYNAYIAGTNPFPHEMGLLLGYPLKDVVGFIENKGDNFLLAGYWKVYADAEDAQKRFISFDRCKDEMIKQLFKGSGFREILRTYQIKASTLKEAV